MLSTGFLLYRGDELQVVLASVFFTAACYIDTQKARIPNVVNASLAIAGLAFNFSATGTKGLTLGLLGMLTGLALLLLPYLMGGFGAGDVKALAALGALVGPGPIVQIFIYMAVIGAILAILQFMENSNLKEKAAQWSSALKAVAMTGDLKLLGGPGKEPLRFPYAAAIALGYYTWLVRGDLL